MLTCHASFLGMIATTATGETINVYSDRFTLTGMTGSFPPGLEGDLARISGTSGPSAVNVTGRYAAAKRAAAPADGDMYTVPYNLQSGLTKYAPMQPVPGTVITATNTAPLYPPSSVVTATAMLPIASIVTTITQAQTFIVTSKQNTVRDSVSHS
jgi:hypothetical protein